MQETSDSAAQDSQGRDSATRGSAPTTDAAAAPEAPTHNTRLEQAAQPAAPAADEAASPRRRSVAFSETVWLAHCTQFSGSTCTFILRPRTQPWARPCTCSATPSCVSTLGHTHASAQAGRTWSPSCHPHGCGACLQTRGRWLTSLRTSLHKQDGRPGALAEPEAAPERLADDPALVRAVVAADIESAEALVEQHLVEVGALRVWFVWSSSRWCRTALRCVFRSAW